MTAKYALAQRHWDEQEERDFDCLLSDSGNTAIQQWDRIMKTDKTNSSTDCLPWGSRLSLPTTQTPAQAIFLDVIPCSMFSCWLGEKVSKKKKREKERETVTKFTQYCESIATSVFISLT